MFSGYPRGLEKSILNRFSKTYKGCGAFDLPGSVSIAGLVPFWPMCETTTHGTQCLAPNQAPAFTHANLYARAVSA